MSHVHPPPHPKIMQKVRPNRGPLPPANQPMGHQIWQYSCDQCYLVCAAAASATAAAAAAAVFLKASRLAALPHPTRALETPANLCSTHDEINYYRSYTCCTHLYSTYVVLQYTYRRPQKQGGEGGRGVVTREEIERERETASNRDEQKDTNILLHCPVYGYCITLITRPSNYYFVSS